MQDDLLHQALKREVPQRLKAAETLRTSLVRMLGSEARECANDEPDAFGPVVSAQFPLPPVKSFAHLEAECNAEARAIVRGPDHVTTDGSPAYERALRAQQQQEANAGRLFVGDVR